MIHRYIKRIGLAFGMLVLANACQMTDLDINTDPNNPTEAALNLLLTSSQLTSTGTFAGVNYNAHGFAGLMSSADDFNLNADSYNGLWNSFYATPMKDVEEMLKATTDGKNPRYRGIAQTMKAFYMGLFVDLFGDVPYTEAWQADAASPIKAPKFDKDSEIYPRLIALCDSAVANLARPTSIAVTGDLFYGGDKDKWTALAKSVKLKLIFNTRKVRPNSATELSALFTEGGFIASPANDFTFRYNSLASPEGRHPWFQNAYLADNGFPHISHQFVLEMIENKDPRLPFYIKRQTETILNPLSPGQRGTIPAYRYFPLDNATTQRLYGKNAFDQAAPTNPDNITEAQAKYLAGFFGRDRGDRTGIPLDGALRMAPGTYPAAGLFDNRPQVLNGRQGGTGAGIFPLLTSTMIRWWKIEAILDNGLAGNAETEFATAMRESITRVVNFGIQVDNSNVVAPTPAAIDAYVNLWLERYRDAPNNTAKLSVVLKQAWFSNWGNGFEIYNALRRTGLPADIDAPREKVRQFALRLPYPSQEIAQNSNAADKGSVAFDAAPVFWDVVKLKL